MISFDKIYPGLIKGIFVKATMDIEQLWQKCCDLGNKREELYNLQKSIIARHPEGNWPESDDKEEVMRLYAEMNELDKQRYKIDDEIIDELDGSFFQLSNGNVLTEDEEQGVVERTPYKGTVC